MKTSVKGLQGWCEWEWERRGSMQATYFLNRGTIMWQGRLRVTVGQQGVRWLQVRSWHDRSHIAWIPLLDHGLTVKLSPCPCSHSSLARRVAARLCGHFKCNLLLTKARPRMIQHLYSNTHVHKSGSELGKLWKGFTYLPLLPVAFLLLFLLSFIVLFYFMYL